MSVDTDTDFKFRPLEVAAILSAWMLFAAAVYCAIKWSNIP